MLKTVTIAVLLAILTWQVQVSRSIVQPIEKIEVKQQTSQLEIVLSSLKCPVKKMKEVTQAIELASEQTNLNPILLACLLQTESGFNPKAVSEKNYKGLMQTPTATFKWADVDILHGARILEEKLKLTKGDIVLALALYKGGNNPMANRQAKQVLALYNSRRVVNE
jgi:soluble lytic murein transglycosylase-like protein